MSEQESLQILFDRFRGGDQEAAGEIWKRFEDSIVRLADQQIGPLMRSKIQPESVMLSVMELALKKIGEGKYRANNSEDFWNLLRRITNNKIRSKVVRFTAEKRDIRRNVRLEDEYAHLEIMQEGPMPQEKAMLAEALANVRSKLKPSNQEVFDLMLQEDSDKEIAEKLEISPHTARRRMQWILDLTKKWALEDEKNDP